MPVETKLIPLTQGYSAIVDATDYEWLSQWKWYIRTADNSSLIYARRAARENGKYTGNVYMHRFIAGAKKGEYVDHINHNSLDNRQDNLRVCTLRENLANQRKTTSKTSSKYKGVSWDKHGKKYRPSIKVGDKTIHLGSFDCEIEAALIYNEAAKKYFGEFALLNEIGEQANGS